MKNFTSTLIFILLLTASTAHSAFATPRNTGADKPLTLFEHIQGPELLKVTLEMDIETLIDNKKTNDFLPAKFSFLGKSGQINNWDIEVRVRGRFRRMTCDFPPLKLKFPKKEMEKEGFGKHNDVKLVTHCLDNKKSEETLFREYLAYQLYAKLTNVSFRTQLIQITYRDINTRAETDTYGILIEDSDELAERMNAKDCDKCFGLPPSAYDRENLQVHDLFQYMIGNTDWSVMMVRNMKVLKPKGSEGGSLVAPYDFDFSGLVNAPYARPNLDIQQKNIRERIYMGANWTAEEWAKTLELYKSKRQELMEVVDQFELLKKKAKKDIKGYLGSFYKQLDQGFVPENTVSKY